MLFREARGDRAVKIRWSVEIVSEDALHQQQKTFCNDLMDAGQVGTQVCRC